MHTRNKVHQISGKNWTGLHAPLSFAQLRMWFLDRIQPEEIAYINTSAYHLTGMLDFYALWRAFNSVLVRHAILRTTYTTVDSSPVQVIHHHAGFSLPLVDTSGLTADDQTREEKRVIELIAQQPINLATETSLRTIAIRHSYTNHTILWSVHHIATDGWSDRILKQELMTLYNAYSQNLPIPLTPLPIQYADYALWQNSWLQGEELERQLDYWRNQLKGFTQLDLPTDFPRPAVQTYRGASQNITLTPEQLTQFVDIVRQEHATLYMGLLAAFMLLLQRYTGQDDIAVGSPIANRNRQEIEGLIGFFVNTMVMRVELCQVNTFRDLIKEVRNTALGAFMHQDLPFEKLVEELAPKRSLSRTPLFQVVFALQNTPRYHSEIQGVDIQRVPTGPITTRFDLECHMYENASGLSGEIIYNENLFQAETMEHMAESFQALIDQINIDPGKNLSEFSLLTESKATKTLNVVNNVDYPYPREKNVCELFNTIAQRYPDAVALVHHDEHITYTCLNVRANQLAQFLLERGVKPGAAVGICTDRSIDMVVGILGILKAGGCYVPIDPTYPQERISFMAADTGIKVILTQTQYQDLFPDTGMLIHCLDNQWTDLSLNGSENPDFKIDPLAPIYIMYTSGSTGRPKGIVIPHMAVVSLVMNANYASLGKTEVIALGSNIAFDAATFELWGALLNGGRIVIFDRDMLLSPRHLEHVLRIHSVTTMFMTTALFNEVARENPSAFSTLRQLLFGGEAVTPKWVKEVINNGPPHRLVHMYGPTETTTFASWNLVTEVEENARTVPIGSPISNTQLYVVDNYLHALPIGAVGELCIAGDGLSMGYISQPGMTAEKFIPNPFCGIPGSRMYRTGDMVRWLPDGVLEFVGRKDQQVKIRGFRIELGEIEISLTRHPGIRDAYVTVLKNDERDKQLAAYIVENTDADADNQTLRNFLRHNLPDYMIPSAYIRLPFLPMTASGKVDRKQLPVPVKNTDPISDIPIISDNLELLLTTIWKSVLHLLNINRNDSFFEIGGHSLLGVQLLERVYAYTGKEIPVSVLFQAPTIAQMADMLRKHDWVPAWSSLVPIRLEGKGYPLFLVPPAGNTVLGFAHITNFLSPTQPVLGLQYKGLDGRQTPHNRVEDIAVHFIHEMRNFQSTGPYILGGFCFGAHVAFEMARQLQTIGDEVALVFILDASAPVSGPTWTGGALINKNIHYYGKRLVELIRRRQLLKVVSSKLNRLRGQEINQILPVNELLVKRNQGIQRVFNANQDARVHYRAMPIKGKLVYITSELFYNFGFVPMWAELAPDDFSYEMFEQTTHRALLLDREKGKQIAGIMQGYLDRLYNEGSSDAIHTDS